MSTLPVIAVFDVGKTNKKLFLFDEDYRMVYERSARFTEITDEDGDACENLESLRLSVFDSLREVSRENQFDIKAINFAAYGASFVYTGEDGEPVAPLYNYLKAYPPALQQNFYTTYGGQDVLSLQTASPALGSLNSGLQLYRIKYRQPELFKRIRYALHLPQYLSYLITGRAFSDITSTGCHTLLWDFTHHDYHTWVRKEGLDKKLAPLMASNRVFPVISSGNTGLNLKNGGSCVAGIGLHDSSAALIPYLTSFNEPFILLSTGTWCISLNPFNQEPLTEEELRQDCLCYIQYQGKPVKASRLFAGYEHEQQVKRIATHFNQDPLRYRTMEFDREITYRLRQNKREGAFAERDLTDFSSDKEAYHGLMLDIVHQQHRSTQLVLKGTPVKRIFVDGGFGRNAIFMHLLAASFPQTEVFAARMTQATAVGAALCIHHAWNSKALPTALMELKYYSGSSRH